ncbi:phospho-sugar mutase [Gephyromycinifex aptenodytis]|uniref:phospho-sugar mutase n=1 Tax=Gephyromycinifex aptenodytis TaxID=2716227 RepID=UPI0014472A14|nr:phospho-sugar mutase [Gephyromycinifex aptenodytis]
MADVVSAPQPEDLAGLLERARHWCAHDPAPAERAALSALIEQAQAGEAEALADLASRFTGPLTFGTAGLRGAVGAGETRMNRAVVARATFGLMGYLNGIVEEPRVVIGCDARHGSADFARTVAQVVAAAGGRALVLPAQLPTPVLAYAVRDLQADAGVMVTASHNPPADNGYKVYLGGRVAQDEARGVQIVPPADRLIAENIAAAPPADQIPGVPSDDDGVLEQPEDAKIVLLDHGVVAGYVGRAASLAGSQLDADISIVLTPLHGVGGQLACDVLATAGFPEVQLVPEQAEPDPDFPTVAFPNPEEPGALDLALDLARRSDADVVIALDPDADRCSVATPDPSAPGGWRQLTGDELGALLGEQAAQRTAQEGDPDTAVLACSIVSSRQLARIAAAHGCQHATTLTGFKWIARTPGIVFGYEEAIGYCTDPGYVRDKDGIGTAVRVAALVAQLRSQGRTLCDALDDLARRDGLHATSQVSFRVSDLQLIGDAMARLRQNPPTVLADSAVVEVADLARGYAGLLPTDGLLLRTERDDRVIVRPSGTEPKLKCYLEVILAACDGRVPRDAAQQRLRQLEKDVSAVVAL